MGGLLLTGCQNWLDFDPTNAQTEDTFYKNRADAYMALIAIYEPLRSDYAQSYHPLAMVSDLLSDDMYAGGGSGSDMLTWQNLSRFQARAEEDTPRGLWKKNYRGISRANMLLSKYEGIEFNESEEADRNNFLGEATFLRGHYYYELLRFFENVPLITSPIAGEDWVGMTQAEPKLVYAQAAQDMLDGIELMAEGSPERGRLSKYAAEAELVKMFLFYTGYYNESELPTADGGSISGAQALAYAEDVINNSGAALMDNFEDLFNLEGDFCKEVLFEIPFTDNGGGEWDDAKMGNMQCHMSGPRGYNSDKMLKSGWGFGIPSKNLARAYSADDLRRKATVVTTTELMQAEGGGAFDASFTNTGYFAFKYTTHADREPISGSVELNWAQNYHYIRLADVYLLAAELFLAQGNAGKALEYVNIIRQRAGIAALPSVSQEDILNERRLELALEGHRYFDLLRQGLPYAEEKISVHNYQMEVYPDEPAMGDIGLEANYLVSFDMSKKGFLPIPRYEIDLNPDFNQNAGY
ncbi:RagB/SusD family nutrient uptake outer membrane protein [Persicobacter psychrovividus]